MKEHNVEWSKEASEDLEQIIDYIALDSIDSAIKIFAKIKSRSEALVYFPQRGRVVPELKIFGILKYRELTISPWRIIYVIYRDEVNVLSVIDSRRDVKEILLERFLR